MRAFGFIAFASFAALFPVAASVLFLGRVSSSRIPLINAQTLRADPGGKQFFYVTDEQGRRFPIMRSSSAAVDISVKPGESVKLFLTFVALAKAGSLYLTGDVGAPAWVRLYFGSDLNPSTGARSCV